MAVWLYARPMDVRGARPGGRAGSWVSVALVALVAVVTAGCSGEEEPAPPESAGPSVVAAFCDHAFDGALDVDAARPHGQQVTTELRTEGRPQTDFSGEPGIGVNGEALCVRGHFELSTPRWRVVDIRYAVELVSPDPRNPLIPHTYELRQVEDYNVLIAPETPCGDVTWTYRLRGPGGATETWTGTSRHGLDCPA